MLLSSANGHCSHHNSDNNIENIEEITAMVYFNVPSVLNLVSTYGDICDEIMSGAFGVEKPHQWQKEAFSHQFHMMMKSLVIDRRWQLKR